MVSIIIVGVARWDDYTRPFLDSIKQFAPGLNVVCVDNGDTYPDYPGVKMVRIPRVTSLPAAFNVGLLATDPSDWYITSSNDMLITKPMPVKSFDIMPDDSLYSFVHVVDALYGFEYIENWMLFTPARVLRGVGLWDEKFAPMWFEAADYAIRAKKAGFRWTIIDREDWGVYHREEERMTERKAYMREHMPQRLANRLYLMEKHGIPRR
jgi:GT2 family glycosyltransferase